MDMSKLERLCEEMREEVNSMRQKIAAARCKAWGHYTSEEGKCTDCGEDMCEMPNTTESF